MFYYLIINSYCSFLSLSYYIIMCPPVQMQTTVKTNIFLRKKCGVSFAVCRKGCTFALAFQGLPLGS